MTTIDFWFDPVSPYAHLAFERLPQALAGLSIEVRYRPVLFAGLLQHWGQKGPAEIAPKRDWTYRHVRWLVTQHGTRLDLPAAHPFNPLPLLRLAWACSADTAGGLTPSRWVCERVLHHVWHGGQAADDAARLAALTVALAPAHDPATDVVKAALRRETEAAVQAGLFGVPTMVAEGRAFWGCEGLEMLSQALRGEPWFDGPDWAEAAAVPAGVVRRGS